MDPESQQIKMAQQITVTTRVQRTRRSSSSKTIALLSLHCFTFTLYLASAPIGATAYRFNSNKDSSQQSSDLHENSIFHPLLPAISSSKKYASKSSTSEKLTVFYQSGVCSNFKLFIYFKGKIGQNLSTIMLLQCLAELCAKVLM